MGRVYFEIIHDGTGEQRFGGKCLLVERHGKSVSELREELQSYLDAWVSNDVNSSRLDQFGDAKDDLTVEEFLSIIPSHLNARMIDTPVRSVFI